MTKPTPGPWKASGQSVLGPIGVPVSWFGEAILFRTDGSYSISTKEAKANARLCAAAPDLLEALRSVTLTCTNMHHSVKDQHQLGETCPVLERAKAAITKATGETP